MTSTPLLKMKVEDWARATIARLQVDFAAIEHSRWLIVAVVAFAWIVLNVYLAANVFQAHRNHRELQSEMVRLNALVGDTSWQGHLQQSEALKLQLNERLWSAATPGLAEAGFERWIREHVAKQGLETPQIQITRAPATLQTANGTRTLPGLQRMTAKVTTSFSATGLAGLNADMVESDKVILVDQLIVRTQRNSRMEMNLSTFVRLE
jgi:hypothetical protein